MLNKVRDLAKPIAAARTFIWGEVNETSSMVGACDLKNTFRLQNPHD